MASKNKEESVRGKKRIQSTMRQKKRPQMVIKMLMSSMIWHSTNPTGHALRSRSKSLENSAAGEPSTAYHMMVLSFFNAVSIIAHKMKVCKVSMAQHSADGITLLFVVLYQSVVSHAECASGDEDFWERKHGSGPASTSQTQAALLAQSTDGRKRLEEIRVSLGTAAGRKAQVHIERPSTNMAIYTPICFSAWAWILFF